MSKAGDSLPSEIQALSFEDALKQLETIVNQLERGDVGLEESIDYYTKGTQLKQHCQTKLADAKARIEKIQVGQNGDAKGAEPFDPEEA